MSPGTSTPLHAAELYWNAAAATYEQDFSGTTVGKIRREIVWSNLERIFQPGQHILELLWFLAHRKPRKAFQRLREPRTSYASTTGLVVYRPAVDDIVKQMKPTFRLLGWKGIGIVVPPSYAEH